MRFSSNSRRFFEEQAAQERFSLRAVAEHLARELPGEQPLELFEELRQKLSAKTASAALQGLLRSVFFIELVKENISSTKFALRWSASLSGDPRFASYDECLSLFDSLVRELREVIEQERGVPLLRFLRGPLLLPYEVPLDYRERRLARSMHVADNLGWVCDDLARRVVELRAFLLDPQRNPQAKAFAAAYDKIRVKMYLTDRVLTGEYKTNREKRWETHPASVHFALRRQCWNIETTLIAQICHFEGFPPQLAQALEESQLIAFGERPFRCPITLEPLRFDEFARELTSPTHGKSNFQVGHLNPFKAVPAEDENGQIEGGHTARNVSWISSDGNRIQGALSLVQTRALLQRIADNYRSRERPAATESAATESAT